MNAHFPFILRFDLGSGALKIIDDTQQFDDGGAFSFKFDIFFFLATTLTEVIKVGSNSQILALEGIALIGYLC
jgi:hypothetical protein